MAKARLFISTDMQMITGVNNISGDKDDVQSLVHALMYQDKFDIVGIASSTSWWQPGANNESFIHHVIDKYGQEQAVLAQHGDGFKSASALHDITYQGTQSLAGPSGIVARTEASDAIIQQAHEASAAGEKLYVATWGGLGDMARALYDAPEIASTVRLLSVVGNQQEPNAYAYIKDNFAGKGDLWWVDEKSTHFGVYATPDTTGAEQTDPAGNIWAETNAQGHGVLGQFFYENTLDVLGTSWPGDGMKMGDSHTVLYLIDTAANNDDPTSESWGGEFQQAGDKYWVDRSDQGLGWAGSEGAMTIYEDRAAWTGDFATRFDWLQAPNPVVSPTPEAPTPASTAPDPVVLAPSEPVIVAPPEQTPPPPVTNTGAEVGLDTIVVKLSQDAYQGNAQYAISVDGKQALTGAVSALHAAGQSQDVTLSGDFGPGQHTVAVAFLNDMWGGTSDTDRNLYVSGITINGVANPASAALFAAGTQSFLVNADTAHVPMHQTIGSGPDNIILHISQDAYQGDAQYTVAVDGQKVGGTLTASALHGAGASDTLAVQGSFGPGQHTVAVSFLNDAFGGSAETDRNLHVDGITLKGVDTGQSGALFSTAGREFVLGTNVPAAPVPASVSAVQPAAAATDPWATFTHDGVVDWAAASAAVTAHYEATGYWGL